MKFRKLLLAALTIIFSFEVQSQSVETIVSSGLDLSQMSTFSSDGKLIAKSSHSELSVWQVKSGRLIKKIQLEPSFMVDSIAFDEKNEHLLAFKMASNDQAIVDFYSGEVVLKTGPTFDYSKLDPNRVYKKNWYKVSKHFSDKKSGYISFPTSQEGVAVRYRNISNDKTVHLMELSIAYEDGYSEILNTHGIVFGDFSFSRDDRYMYANGIVYDLKRRRIFSRLKSIKYLGNGAFFAMNSHIPVTAGVDNIVVWNFPTKRKIKVENVANIIKISDSITGCLLYEPLTFKSSYQIVNIQSGKKIGKEILFKKNTYKYSLSPNQKWLFVQYTDMGGSVFNVETGEEVTSFDKNKYTDFVDFNKKNQLLFLSSDSTSYLLHLGKNKKTDYSLEGFDINVPSYYTFHTSSGYVFKTFLNNETKIWDKSTGKLVKTFTNFLRPIDMHLQITPDQSKVVFFSSTGGIRIHDMNTGEKLSDFKLRDGYVLHSDISYDNKYLITSTLSGAIKYWEFNTGKEILSIIVTGPDDFLIKLPENYYYTTRKATDYIHFKKGKEIFAFEQFDLKFNRPDKVLAKLDYVDPMLVKAYKKAYLKRLRKMNFTEDMLKNDFHLPKLKVKNLEEMPLITDSSFLELNLNINDEKYKLDRINIWVNDVAVHGSNGISIRELNTTSLERKLRVNLALGTNKIQLSVLNQSGAESYKEAFEIDCKSGKKTQDLYLLTIGESAFKSSEYNLKYGAKDAKDVSVKLSKSKVYKNVFSKVIINEQATKDNILQLDEFLKKADINDQVILFFAGHGVLDEELDYYLATHDMDFQNPTEKGLAYENLEGLRDGIAPLKKTLIMDACHSGEIDKDEVELMANAITEEGDIQFRAVGNAIKPKLGTESTSELMKSLFTDLRKGTGATVISSAGGVEFAMESDQWQNGLFTYCLLNGIKSMKADENKDGEIWLSELQKYVQLKVLELSNGQQKPTSRIENNTLDYRIW